MTSSARTIIADETFMSGGQPQAGDRTIYLLDRFDRLVTMDTNKQ
jgi:hypothetical protein